MSAYRNKPQAVIFQPDLKNKVAIVTGAGRGIGQAVALAFARHGAKLVLAARTTSELHRNLELEDALVQRGKSKDAELIRRLSGLIEIRTVHQEAPLGSADAIRSACSLVGNEPFAVILPDVLIDAPIPCTRQSMSCYEQHPGCVIAARTIDPKEADRFGVLDVIPLSDECCGGRTLRVTGVMERPQLGSVLSHHGIFGRYI